MEHIRNIRDSAAVAVAYLCTAQLGLWAGNGQLFRLPVWVADGLALAAVLLLGYRIWPGLLLGATLAGAWGVWQAGAHSAGLILAGSLCLALGNTAEALLGAWLVRRFAGGREALSRPQTILRFVLVAAFSSLLVGASAVVATASVTELVPAPQLRLLWFNSWLGILLGTLVIAPLILAWAAPGRERLSAKRAAEAAVLVALLLLLCLVLFLDMFEVRARSAPLSFLLIPVLLWSAWRFGQRGTTAVAFIIASVATAATMHGRGPFALGQTLEPPLLLQNYLAVITVMSLLFAADLKLREQVELELRASEQRYRDLFYYNPEPMWLVDYESLQILAVNRAAEQAYGYSRADFLGMELPDLWLEVDRPGLRETMRQAREGLEMRCDCRHLRKDGTVIDVNVSSRNLLFDGRPAAVLLSQDITERKLAERQTAAFSELSRRLSVASSAKEAAEAVMATADGLFGWDACVFELCRAGEEELKIILVMDTVNGKRQDITFTCTDGAPGVHTLHALKESARLILRPYPPVFAPDMEPFGDKQRPSASLMFAPVRVENEAIAVLSVQSYRHNAYSETDLRLFQALADHCGSALKRVRAEAELRESNLALERRVSERTAQLEATNRELEAFSYSVSHDLRAPLRSIRGFSDLILELYAGKLDARGQDLLRRVCEASLQMGKLIDDVLKLSRVGRSELQHQLVDLSALGEAIARELHEGDPARVADVTISPGLQARGDERLLRIMLENLLRNAWKFSAKKPAAHIEFGFARKPQPAFFVRDNGAGFDMAHASKLFGVFQRLHSSSEFPGTGVGLATVQRIINRHGGRVWAEADLGQGATFYFTLPAGDAAPLERSEALPRAAL